MTKFAKIILKICLILLLLGITLFFFKKVDAASLYLSPSSGSYTVGQPFTVSVYVSSPVQAMNAISGKITFPANLLQVSSLSQVGSIINLWIEQPSFVNVNGTIDLEGIVFDPGYKGSSGKVIDIVFSPKAQGTASVRMTLGSILANDGSGTNILERLGSASYNITGAVITTTTTKTPLEKIDQELPKAPKIYSSTHPNSDEWYSDSTAKFSWDLTSDITEIRLSISRSEEAMPTITYSSPIKNKTVTNLQDGVWYFNVQFKNKSGWGEISRFRIQIKDLGFKIPETQEPIISEEEETREIGAINIINYFIVIIIVLILSHILTVFIVRKRYLRKMNLLKKELNQESKEIKIILFDGFDILREEVSRIVTNLDGNPALSPREKQISQILKKAIRDAELLIYKELGKAKKKRRKKIKDN